LLLSGGRAGVVMLVMVLRISGDGGTGAVPGEKAVRET
jgi:hypothetical protein